MYSAVVLDEKSQLALSAWADKNIKINNIRLPILVDQNGWRMICHHMTIQFPGIPDYIKQYLDTEQTLEVTHVGIDDNAVAVRVVGFPSVNKIPHITVAVSPKGKPAMSNDIKNWKVVTNGPSLKGTVKEIQ